MSKQTDEMTGLKKGTAERAQAVLHARIGELMKISKNSVKLSERKQAQVHADMLRTVLKEIF